MTRIDFIICSNRDNYREECKAYINSLHVPNGVEIEIRTLENVKSLAEGYNTAISMSNAKYRVFLHQDTFIINKNFISEVLKIFENNLEIGMIGVIGGNKIIKNGCYWNAWNTGRTYASTPRRLFDLKSTMTNEVEYVWAIDGMIMITQYDIPWRSDLFDGFDYYDVSQSVEMRKKGYKIVVPCQEEPWCLHDCGCTKFYNYEKYRKIFCDAYHDEGYVYEENEAQDMFKEKNEISQKYYEMAVSYFESFNWEMFDYMMINANNMLGASTNLQILYLYWEWIKEDISRWERNYFDNTRDFNKFIDNYVIMKFIIRRIEYDIELGNQYKMELDNIMKSEMASFFWALTKRVSVNSNNVTQKIMNYSSR